MAKQLFLDLDFSTPHIPEQDITHKNELRPVELQAAVLGWMASQDAAGLAVKTPTRLTRFLADVAGFWNQPRRFRSLPGPGQLYVPTCTMIVECRRRRQDCWPDFAKSAQLLPDLRKLKQERLAAEAEIRANEPHLRETATLFEEYSDWYYERSENHEYHRLRREIDKLTKALYHGTRFESILSAHLADFVYLAVPEKTVHPHELADGWGLIWIRDDLTTQLIVRAEAQPCPPENRFHLVQNIASAAARSVLFENGVDVRRGKVRFHPRPRRRQSRRRPPA